MFICSVRASTIKFFCVVALALGVLATLILLIPSYDVSASGTASVKTVNYTNIKTNEDRVAFLAQFGWTVSAEPVKTEEFTIPSQLDRVLAEYNEIQKKQGLDLSRYEKKTVTRYTYTVENYPGADGTVYANITIYKNRVIAGDICSSDPTGFVHGLEGK